MSRRKQKTKPRKILKNTPTPDLTEKQKKAAQMLYDVERVSDIAAALGIHRVTLWRWEQKRAFRKELQRIDRNYRRRINRKLEKEREAWEARRAETIRICEEKLQREASKVINKPSKAFDNAWNSYQKALLGGFSLSTVLKMLYSDNPLKYRKRRR